MSARAEPLCVTLGLFDNPTSLIYGIGNDGRQDDGLGWAFIDRLEQIRPRPHACLRRTYQLSLEDADLISRYTRVLFVDATKDPAVQSFTLSRPEPKLDFSFTSHALSVPAILATTQQCFDHIPDAYLLAIRGYEWELQQGLTRLAQHNLSHSLESCRHPGSAGSNPHELRLRETDRAKHAMADLELMGRDRIYPAIREEGG